MKKVVVDTNIILRFILNDSPELAKKAKSIIEKNDLYLDQVVFAEVIWVLLSFYKKEKIWTVDILTKFLKMPTIVNDKKYLMLSALELFSKKNLSYIDCWIYVVSRDLKLQLKTQDKKLAKLK